MSTPTKKAKTKKQLFPPDREIGYPLLILKLDGSIKLCDPQQTPNDSVFVVLKTNATKEDYSLADNILSAIKRLPIEIT